MEFTKHICDNGHVTQVSETERTDRGETFELCPICRHQEWRYACNGDECKAPDGFTNCITRELIDRRSA